MNRDTAGRMRQLIRCHRLLDCLSSSRIGYNAGHLAEEFGCTTKTVYRDLRALREAGVQIWYDPRSRRYRLVQCRLVEGYLGLAGDDTAERESEVGDLRIGLRQAGRYLGVSPYRLKELVWRDELPVIQSGGRVQFRIEDLVRYKRLLKREACDRGGQDDGRITRTRLPVSLAG